jgi:hypothetical protein
VRADRLGDERFRLDKVVDGGDVRVVEVAADALVVLRLPRGAGVVAVLDDEMKGHLPGILREYERQDAKTPSEDKDRELRMEDGE